MGKLILVRHGKSLWNIENIFTGWTDVDLAPQGIEEAKIAGELIRDKNIAIDICFSSYLKRAIKTAAIILETADLMQIDFIKSWKLNERNYGAWQGRNKDEIRQEVGEDIFWNVRRGYTDAAPALQEDDKRCPKFEVKYKMVNSADLPLTESLEDTKQRAVQYYFEAIVPELVQGKTVLVSAHGNSIRALMTQILDIPPAEISTVEVQTGILNIYDFDNCMILKSNYKIEQKIDLTL
ncbi:2,3-bisphosphoglycerate-dependent phosphoglycerate mutase [Frigoriflavimonas asaccharolytica]|uniref:2,3-bisphosphoglycerate-dependent phosphoglycerate mutase n=1 Tax=Frigoriflavimonas asaccharolytica TaxID=2735899 RepID=A0A8J8K9J9_9FLAO|nr:2,3-bisphosphoglycerate-dependent phosphoglycerate mutase [Frigoriflavimonas asaccharolytica]NRS93736.1 2,3-bisphosphoglycerate-dependent phosphoglycerate mutase [Frigoriflavimonas asaccharolytica]